MSEPLLKFQTREYWKMDMTEKAVWVTYRCRTCGITKSFMSQPNKKIRVKLNGIHDECKCTLLSDMCFEAALVP